MTGKMPISHPIDEMSDAAITTGPSGAPRSTR